VVVETVVAKTASPPVFHRVDRPSYQMRSHAGDAS
jgi:hypothetical protein